MIDIQNAAPMVNDLGTQDLSARQVGSDSLEIPQHLPKYYIFAGTGPVGPHYLDLSKETVTEVYGDITFDVKSKYYTHQTPFLQAAVARGNNCVVHRLLGTGAKDVANVGFYLDILPKVVNLYEKNSDGTLKLDEQGQPIKMLDSSNNPVTVNGYSVAWVADYTEVPYGKYQPGLLSQRPGIQVEGQTQSTQYPIFEMSAEYAGEFGKQLAARMYAALTTNIVPFPDLLFSQTKVYPHYFQLMKLSTSVAGKVDPVLNGFGGQYSKFVFKADVRDPASDAVIDLKTVLEDNYINPASGVKTGLGFVKVYDENIAEVSKMLYEAEMVVADSHRDECINNSEQNYFAINLLGFTSSNGSPYQAIKIADVPGSIRMTKNSNHFFGGASDGTMNEDLLDQLVADDMENYQNTLTDYHDLVMHPESIVYDSGFALATKRALCKMISKRKDTFIVLATAAHNAPSATLDEQNSVGIALKTAVELYPESSHFGTRAMRAMIMGGSGEIINSLYKKRVPTSYEVNCMASNYMGAANGAWKNGYSFDKASEGGSIIKNMHKLDVTWVPNDVRRVLWGTGVNFALNYSVRQQFFPALQTVYDDDTSVLNSFFTAVAISYLNKIEHAAWREFSGDISLTPAQLVERVDTFVAEKVKDRFDGKFIIVPNTTITARDEQRGYSWTLGIKIFSPSMKSVMTTYVQAYRMSDYEA